MNADWTTKPLKRACTINRRTLGEDTHPDWEMQYLDISAVDSGGNVASLETHTFENAPSRARRRVTAGDTVISTVRTYLRAIAHFDQPPENLIASTGFAVLSPNNELDSRFLWRAVQDHGFVSQVVANSEGVGYPAVAPTRLAGLPLSFPPVAEQRRIAGYLDEATGKIDRLMGLRRRQMELLKEQRASLIQQAVTRGLNPNAPTQELGVTWVGRVPAHWRKLKLSHLARRGRATFTSGPFGSELLTSELTHNGVPVVYIRDIKAVGYRRVSDACVTVEKAAYLDSFRVDPGDVVIAKVGDPPGTAAVYPAAEPRGIFTQDVIRLKPDTRFVTAEFIVHWLNSKTGQACVDRIAIESTRMRVDLASYKSLPIWLPPRDEQEEIVTFISKRNARLDGLLSAYARQVELLAEYRSALIHECVTGQRPVPNCLARTKPGKI